MERPAVAYSCMNCHSPSLRTQSEKQTAADLELHLVANNFWGKDDAGVGPLLERMAAAKLTCDELKTFYGGAHTLLAAQLQDLQLTALSHTHSPSIHRGGLRPKAPVVM